MGSLSNCRETIMVRNEGILNGNEETEDEEDDESDSTTVKRAPRRALFDLDTKKAEEKEAEAKRKLTLTDRLFENMAAKKVPDQDKEKAGEKEDEEESEPTDDEPIELEHAEADEKPVETANEKQEATEVDAADTSKVGLEAADWEPEGELEDEGEINLGFPVKSESEPEEEKAPEFIEIPPTPPLETNKEPAAETGPVEPELLEVGLGAEGPPEPPEDEPPVPTPGGEEEPVPSRPMVPVSGGDRGGSGWYNAAAAERARQAELDEAEYQGAKRGQRSGVGAGLFFGWLLGRHGKKKQAKEFAAQVKSKNKEIADLKNEQFSAAERLKAVQRNQEIIQANIAKEGVKPTVGPENAPQGPLKATEAAFALATVPQGTNREKAPLNTESTDIKIEKQSKTPEKTAKPAAELAPEDRPITEETYKAPEGSRIETSSWHRIEIDAKTGKAVANPELAYGEEFKRERRQEIKREDNADGGTSGGSPVMQLGGLAASSVAQSSSAATTASSAGRAAASEPIDTSAHKHLTAGSEMLRYASMPAIWLAAALVVVVLFLFGILR
jgi:hypothetical protein